MQKNRRGALMKVLGRALVALVVLCVCCSVPKIASAAPAKKWAAATYVRPEQLNPKVATKTWKPVGAVESDRVFHVSVVLPPTNTTQLNTLLADLYNPKSSEYHHWLGAGEFERRFGPAPTSVKAVESWLEKKGFESVSHSGFSVDFSASEAKIDKGLGVKVENYRSDSGKVGYSVTQAPLVPSAIGSDISGIVGLNSLSSFTPDLAAAAPAGLHSNSSADSADGLKTCSAAQNAASSGYYTLNTLGSDYGLDSLLSDGLNGHGETIGLYELAGHSTSDVNTYKSCFGLTNPLTTVPVLTGGVVGGSGTEEADIDIEQVMTQAPEASVISYEGPNTASGPYDVWQTIVDDDAAQVVSTSWGACEPESYNANWIQEFDPLFMQAASQGQTILAASGDSGSEDCFRTGSNTAEEVDYPASDPYVTAVGGTSLWSQGDEVVWNDCETTGYSESVSCANHFGGQAAGGGGMSRYEARPSFQPNVLTWSSYQPCGTTCREVPDISANAGVGMVAYVDGSWGAGGGTSFAAPFLAGLVADRNDGCQGSTGLWTSDLYELASQGSYGSAFTDITSGNNDMTGSNGGNYAAGSGYDPVSGIGSPIAQGLTCPDVTSISPENASPGAEVTVNGLGLEHSTIYFGGVAAQVVSESATQATVVVPDGGGSVSVSASGSIGSGSVNGSFGYEGSGAADESGYDLVGADGGVFVLSPSQSGFYGSLPGLGIKVDNIRGMVPSSDDRGYYLVGSDGGVFAFGDAQFANSLPGLKVHVNNIVGIVPTSDDRGYFLVGSDGGVFAFGDAPFLGSLPGDGVHTDDVIAIAATPSDNGYWVVASNGRVYSFGNATNYGSVSGSSSPVSGIASTPDGGGYWIVTRDGGVYSFGDAVNFGSLPGIKVTPSKPIIGLVPTEGDTGYWLIGSDGGVFAFGDAPYVGSLPALRVSVSDIVGAVPVDS